MARRLPPKKPAKPSTARSSKESALLRRLDAALSEDEIRHVLATVLLGLSATGRAELWSHLPPETAATLDAVLSPQPRAAPRATPEAPLASKGKLRQEWTRLWQQWDDVVAETADEKGKYIRQEAHWEPPYVDTSAISMDLDAIAAKMRPLIPRVFAEGVAPDFSFADVLGELDEELFAGLPDWLDPSHGDGCTLGLEATSCLLEWEWATAQRDGLDAQTFFDDLGDLEGGFANFQLDKETIEAFTQGRRPTKKRARSSRSRS